MARKLPRFLSVEEVKRLFRAAESHERDLLILKCLFYLGLRNSELLNLRVADIDFLNGTVKVVSGKGKKDRLVPLPKNLAKDLVEYVDKNGLRDDDRIFYVSPRHLRRIVKRYAVLAGLRNAHEVHPHTLRHSYATHLQNSGVPLNVIQQVLGHERIETTTIYVHLGIERIRESISRAFLNI